MSVAVDFVIVVLKIMRALCMHDSLADTNGKIDIVTCSCDHREGVSELYIYQTVPWPAREIKIKIPHPHPLFERSKTIF